MANQTSAVSAGAESDQQMQAVPATASADSLSEQRTGLSVERTNLALERTLEAWIRTALSMISFGFTLGKLVQSAENGRVTGLFGERTWSISGLAYFLVTTGVFALVCATLQHWLRVRDLREKGLPRQFDLALLVAIVVSVIGALAFTALVLDL